MGEIDFLLIRLLVLEHVALTALAALRVDEVELTLG
jgi:hypothetical protein